MPVRDDRHRSNRSEGSRGSQDDFRMRWEAGEDGMTALSALGVTDVADATAKPMHSLRSNSIGFGLHKRIKGHAGLGSDRFRVPPNGDAGGKQLCPAAKALW
jgi:hypothetical protein